MNIAQIMIPKVCTVFLHEHNTVRQGLEVMTRNGYSAIPVLDEAGGYVGSVSEGDFLRHVMAVGTTELRAHEQYRIASLVRRDFCPPLSIEAEDATVIEAIMNQNFVPIVDDYYKGMATTVALHRSQLRAVPSLHALRRAYADYYAGQAMVHVDPDPAESPAAKLYANAMAGRNDLRIVVAGSDEAFTVTALFDNLGKGASGAAVQNMNILLGLPETTGLL